MSQEYLDTVKAAYQNIADAIVEFDELVGDSIVTDMCGEAQEIIANAAIQILKYCPCCGEEAIPVDVVNENETQTEELLPCVFELDAEEGMLRLNMYGDGGELLEITGWEELSLLEEKNNHKTYEVVPGISSCLRNLANQIERKHRAGAQ